MAQRHGQERPSLEQAFGNVLREVRKERGFSQEALSFEAGYHRTYMGMLERGLMNPSLKTILTLASVLGVPAGEIVTRVEAIMGKGWRREIEKDRRRQASTRKSALSKT